MTEIKEVIKAPEVQPPGQPESEYKLSKESAINELQKMLDYYEIAIDEIEDEDLKKGINMAMGRAIKAIRLGRLKVKVAAEKYSGIEIIQTTRKGAVITYQEIDGESKTAMAGKKSDDNYGRAYALMGSLSGLGEKAISSLKGVDVSLAEVMGMIFLAV